jgi:Uma2 family endonuclease
VIPAGSGEPVGYTHGMGHPQPVWVSEAEFLELPESMHKIELLDGEVIVPPAPNAAHQHVVSRVFRALADWADDVGGVWVGLSPLDVRFGPDRILQPDVLAILDPEFPMIPAVPIDRIPDLCVEVLSRDRTYDRITKRMVYAAAGVREYWVFHQIRTVERFSGPDLEAREVISEGALESALLPGFTLDLDALYAAVS